MFEKTVAWLSQERNLSLVIHTGDIVGNTFDQTAWRNAYQYMHQLDNKTKWVVIAGDDVFGAGGASFKNYERFFGNMTDQYVVIENRILFIFLNTMNEGGEVSNERLEWMDQVIQNHNDLLVVLCMHHSLFEFPLLADLSASDAGEIWNHLIQHDNVIMTLSGHVHLCWVRVNNNQNKIWALSTEALIYRGYIRFFDFYQDRIEVYAYSAWENKAYVGTLDRFTIWLNATSNDEDRDLWNNGIDIMPTHPFVPNGMICLAAIEATMIMYWARKRRAEKTTDETDNAH